jgi:hypothetical protein
MALDQLPPLHNSPHRSSGSFARRRVDRFRHLISAALRLTRPLDAEIVRLTDVKNSVWPLSFWKEVYRQYQLQMVSTHSIVDPDVGCVNSRTVERKDPQISNAIRC